MNSFSVKEEWPLSWAEAGARETPPQAMEGLNGTGPPPFLNKTYDLVDDLATNFIVSWGIKNNTFVVWDPQLFSLNLLPRYFKHSNFSSFVRQLNTYGFRKVDADKWEFANEGFLRGKKHLLKNIKRKKTCNSQTQYEDQDIDSCIELGRFGVDAEIDILKREKRVLMEELLKLRQEQQSSRAVLKAMEERIIGTERKHKRTKRFLVRALPNQRFVQELIQQKDSRKELGQLNSNKRRRPIEQGNFRNMKFGELRNGGEGNDFDKKGLENYGEVTNIDDSGLDRLAMEMQLGGGSKNLEEGYLRKEKLNEGGNGGLDQMFWENLMNDSIEEENFGSFGFVREEDELRHLA